MNRYLLESKIVCSLLYFKKKILKRILNKLLSNIFILDLLHNSQEKRLCITFYKQDKTLQLFLCSL